MRAISLAFPALLATLTAMPPALLRAQEGQFTPGRSYIGPALSLSSVGSAPAIGGHFEHAVSRNLGVGALAGYWSYGSSLGGISTDLSYVSLGGTASYHFPVNGNSRWDPFVGAALGYYIVSVSSDAGGLGDFSEADSRMFAGAFGGTRYFVSPGLALVGRAGIGSAYVTLGVDFQF